MKIKDRFLDLITTDFEGDSSFVGENLQANIDSAESDLYDLLGAYKFKEFKQEKPLTVTSVADDVLGIKFTVANTLEEDDIVLIVGAEEYAEKKVVLEATTSYIITTGTYDASVTDSLTVITKFFDDILSAGAYLTASRAVLNMKTISSSAGTVSSYNYEGNTIRSDEYNNINKISQKFKTEAISLINYHKDTDDKVGTSYSIIGD